MKQPGNEAYSTLDIAAAFLANDVLSGAITEEEVVGYFSLRLRIELHHHPVLEGEKRRDAIPVD